MTLQFKPEKCGNCAEYANQWCNLHKKVVIPHQKPCEAINRSERHA